MSCAVIVKGEGTVAATPVRKDTLEVEDGETFLEETNIAHFIHIPVNPSTTATCFILTTYASRRADSSAE